MYKCYKLSVTAFEKVLSAGKTRSSILISCGARLAPFDIRELMETGEMELDALGDRKTALFVIISDTDDTFNFVVSILILSILVDTFFTRISMPKLQLPESRNISAA